ncbi:MAG TPA: hypothetical protein VF263_25110 [Longimicrobiaceae bacterium]
MRARLRALLPALALLLAAGCGRDFATNPAASASFTLGLGGAVSAAEQVRVLLEREGRAVVDTTLVADTAARVRVSVPLEDGSGAFTLVVEVLDDGVAVLRGTSALSLRRGAATPVEITLTPATPPLAEVAAGGRHSCALARDGRAFCWGNNTLGELGDGTTAGRNHPGPVAGGLAFRAISAGGDHTCALALEGRLYCWGSNAAGQLGNGATSGSSRVPVPVAGQTAFQSVSAGATHTCAVAADAVGSVLCWGSGTTGELGDSVTTGFRPFPAPVSGRLGARAVSAGTHSCAVAPGDRAFCWGGNRAGELGDGSTVTRRTPVAVAGGLAFRAVYAGREHTCGVTPDDRPFCWGANDQGQLGTGAQGGSLVPAAVAGGLAVRVMGKGGRHTCVVARDGRAHCWGFNLSGQLGNGSTSGGAVPVPVSGGRTFTSIAAGLQHTCALTQDGRAFCWGLNATGQLGTGSLADSRVPVPVP